MNVLELANADHENNEAEINEEALKSQKLFPKHNGWGSLNEVKVFS